MAEVVVQKVVDNGDDAILITGTVDGNVVQAHGWLSAMTNHFDPEDYDEDGQRKDDATPREMTDIERLEYCQRLLVEAAPTTKVIYEA